MPALSDQIAARAAAKLPLPKERRAPLVLEPYERFIRVEMQRLQMRHRAGAGGREICRGHAAVLDAILRNLWERGRNNLSEQAQREFPQMSVVAIGGYGRGELNPYSDLDVMLLHYGQVARQKPLPHLDQMIQSILLPLFDLGFKVGHSVRTIQDCVEQANADMQTKTSLIEARLIIGDHMLFARFQKTLVAKCVVGHEESYILSRLEDQASRRKRHGNSPTMQEPNVKNGGGGLRDFQNLIWMAFFKHRARSLDELQAGEFITSKEAAALEKAYDFLLRVRNQMHYQTGRASDVLLRSLQPTIASKMGYADRSPSRRLEAFMRVYYNHSRLIHLITRTVEDRLALLPRNGPLPRIGRLIRRPFARKSSPPVDGFTFQDGQILAASKRVFRDSPRRLIRVFHHAQQRGLRLHPDTAQLIRHQLDLIDRTFQRDDQVRDTFLDILNRRGHVARVLRPMHETGFLGKYLPEFGRMTCRVQHEFYHQYTVDEHTLVCLEKLDLISDSEKGFLARYAEMFQKVEHPCVLYFAMLLHDAAKGQEGNHSTEGAQIAQKVGRRLALEARIITPLKLLIEEHLTMAQISQRRDLEDAAVIRKFSRIIQSVENLRMLTLHTLADSLATSDKLWNGFKNSLLLDLHHKTKAELEGNTVFIRKEATRQRLQIQEAVAKAMPRTISDEELEIHFRALPPRYYQIHTPKEMVTDLVLTHRFLALQLSEDTNAALHPVVAWKNDTNRGYTRLKICTWDREHLFNIMAGSFAAAGINILGAQAFTRNDDIVLDTFFVTDLQLGGPVSKADRDLFESILVRALTQEDVDFDALIAKKTSGNLPYPSLTGDEIELRISFDDTASENRTVIEVESEDRLGFLFDASRILAELGLNVRVAKVLTENGAAIDSFYVTEAGRRTQLTAEQQKKVDIALRKGLKSAGKMP